MGLPLPKTAAGKFGWLKHYMLDWLGPTLASIFGSAMLVFSFLYAAKNASGSSEFAFNAAVQVVIDAMKRTSTGYFATILATTLLVGVVLSLHQHFTFRRPTLSLFGWIPMETRRMPIFNPTAYWTLFSGIKVFGMLKSPLAFALAFAASVKDYNLLGNLGVAFLIMAIIALGIYLFMFSEMEPPVTLSLSIRDRKPNVRNATIIDRHESMSGDLKKAAMELGDAVGGVWNTSDPSVDKAAVYGHIIVNLRRNEETWNAEERKKFLEKIAELQSKWSSANGYDFSIKHPLKATRGRR